MLLVEAYIRSFDPALAIVVVNVCQAKFGRKLSPSMLDTVYIYCTERIRFHALCSDPLSEVSPFSLLVQTRKL